MQFPTFDLSAFNASTGTNRRLLYDRLDYIFTETGFWLVQGHVVGDEIIAVQWKVVDAFFGLPVEKK